MPGVGGVGVAGWRRPTARATSIGGGGGVVVDDGLQKNGIRQRRLLFAVGEVTHLVIISARDRGRPIYNNRVAIVVDPGKIRDHKA